MAIYAILVVLLPVLSLPSTEVLADLIEDRVLSLERARNDARIAELVRGLSDTGVAVAARQLEALKAVR